MFRSPISSSFPSRARVRAALAALAVAAIVLVGGTVGAQPASAATGRCVEFNPDGPSADLPIGVGVGPVSIGSQLVRNPFRLCTLIETSGGRVTAVGYQLRAGKFDLVYGDQLCFVHTDVDLWDGASNVLYFHSQGAILSVPSWARPNCFNNGGRMNAFEHTFTATRRAGLPIVLRPGTAVCATLYRNALQVGAPPQLTARICTPV